MYIDMMAISGNKAKTTDTFHKSFRAILRADSRKFLKHIGLPHNHLLMDFAMFSYRESLGMQMKV